PLVAHDFDTATTEYDRLLADPGRPLLNRAVSETFPPGSTFKVVVAAAALEHGLTPDSVLTGGSSYTAPDTTVPIQNAPGVQCADQITLRQALTVSCNTAFARYGVEQLGAEELKRTAEEFGFETTPVIDQDTDNRLAVTASHTGEMTGPDGTPDRPAL